MFNYQLVDSNSKNLGVISLESPDLPELLMGGTKFSLVAEYVAPIKEFLHFIVMPVPAVEEVGPIQEAINALDKVFNVHEKHLYPVDETTLGNARHRLEILKFQGFK